MSSKLYWFVTVLLIAIVLGGFLVAGWGVINLANDGSLINNTHYFGNIYFETEEEYTEFKKAIIETEAVIDPSKTVILSSEPPVIGEFNVSVDSNVIFPYGERDRIGERATSFAILGIGLVIASFAGVALVSHLNEIWQLTW